jgi:hypothetical protein
MLLLGLNIPHPFLWSQVAGGVSFVTDYIRFRQTSRARVLVWGAPVGISLVLSQILNQQYQGASMSTASMLSSLAQAPFGRNSAVHRKVRLTLGLGFGGAGVWLTPPGADWITWLPLAGYLVGRVGETSHDFLTMRRIWLLSTSLYLLYHFLMRNWMTSLTELLVLGMSIQFLCRHPKGYSL